MPDNFNYISFGDPDRVIDGVLEMNRGRMFEYTPTELEKSLQGLDSLAIVYLETLPTFLCSEANGSSMLVRYGAISGIDPGRKEVAATFTTVIDFGRIEFDSIEAAREAFKAERFQLYRTHWAVREGDAREILERLSAIKPPARAPAEPLEVVAAAADAEPPQREKVFLGEADSVESFLRELEKATPDEGATTFFRGHANAKFELTPSLLRRDESGAWQYMPKEDRLCKELLIAHYDDFQSDQYSFDRLVRMQHYKLPTRLLDITSNPLVALYFACEALPEGDDVDGEVIVFTIADERIKYYDSDTVSCISNLSSLSYAQKNQIDLSLDINAFNASPVVMKLLHHIKSEKGFFESRIVPEDLGSILCVKAKLTNTRIRSQSGAFLLFGHEATLPDHGVEGVAVTRVTIRNKERILQQLDRLNINATTVYPSIEETALHLKARHRG